MFLGNQRFHPSVSRRSLKKKKKGTCSASVNVHKLLDAGARCSEQPSLLSVWISLHKAFPLSSAHILHAVLLTGPPSPRANHHTGSSKPLQLKRVMAVIKEPLIITRGRRQGLFQCGLTGGHLLITAALTCVDQHTHHPIPSPTKVANRHRQGDELGRASVHAHITNRTRKQKKGTPK